MRNPIIVALIAVFAVAAYGQNEKEKETISKEIEKVMTEQVEAWNRGDIDAFMSGYWQSEEMTFVSDNSISKGWKAALDRYKRGYDTREKMGSLEFSDAVITILDKNNAYVLGRFTLERKDDRPTGLFTLVFRKTKEGWKIIHDHTST